MHSQRSRLISRALGCAFLSFLIGLARNETASAATIFGTGVEPEFLGDLTNYELGTYFESSVAGEIMALRVYVGPVEAGNPGTIVGNLWDANGNNLASATFSNIVAGWNEVALATPISIAPDTIYVVSANTNARTTATGAYAAQSGFFASGSFSNPPLTALSGEFGSPGTFPTQIFDANSYFRDVEFLPVLSVQIEVQPFVPKDTIILNSPLPLPVVVFGSSMVDVTKIDAATLRFGPKDAAPLFSQIVTVDGQQDLVAFFEVQDTGLAVGDTQGCLQGKISGQLFRGCDDVVVIMLRGCGLGFELAPILPALLWLRGRRRRRLA